MKLECRHDLPTGVHLHFAKQESKNVIASRCLGIWMDDATAHIVTYPRTGTITSVTELGSSSEDDDFTPPRSVDMILRSAGRGHEPAYYQKLASIIVEYDQVLLLGPADAKKALCKVLHANCAFEHVRIELQHAERMTDLELHSCVSNYFSKN